ncbi:PREDICTED: calcium-binding protein 4-like, partial [Chaetura pelagica]|uniref:calcium-binding protein 4-like n=1 Tax=Chaetura pelagica TaxID=8897 RepID=UPI0005239CD3
PVPMPRSRGDKKTPKDTETPGKGKGDEVGKKIPKAPEDGGPPATKAPGSESRPGGHGHKSSRKGPGDPHAAATKAYSPFLNTVFGKAPGSESRPGGHGHKSSRKGPGDPHAAATKAYSPFLNTVFVGGRVDFEDFVQMMGPKLREETAHMVGVKELKIAFREVWAPPGLGTRGGQQPGGTVGSHGDKGHGG